MAQQRPRTQPLAQNAQRIMMQQSMTDQPCFKIMTNLEETWFTFVDEKVCMIWDANARRPKLIEILPGTEPPSMMIRHIANVRRGTQYTVRTVFLELLRSNSIPAGSSMKTWIEAMDRKGYLELIGSLL
ncbi:hypothetical protein N7462_005118 [Penicillium macrosclerotiorum]|uniref:uncharacterized protein n=1 Tax=Penicillium macrosclerotiorum TaxID=303699 RepID=UPI002547C4C8|nr:uncharacterized protein N7462_005118 [Penicillium macrosclerotiorum]KAJ5690726.1 hypothetical protein N7462_005118 [Penicillium macrosclerotiorum]